MQSPQNPTLHHDNQSDDQDPFSQDFKSLFDQNNEDAREFEEYLEEHGNTIACPVLVARDYNLPGRWSEDIVVITDNALRREVFDLYEIMTNIGSFYKIITYRDLWAFRQWWHLFSHFWDICVRADKQILVPLVATSFEVSKRMEHFNDRFKHLRNTRDWLTFKLEEMTAYIHSLGKLPSGKILALLFKALREFTLGMLKYFDMKEKEYPMLLRISHDAGAKLATDLKILSLFRSSKYPEESIVFLVRWMTNRHQKAKWLNTRLTWRERPVFQQYMQQFHSRHSEVVERFKALKKRENGHEV